MVLGGLLKRKRIKKGSDDELIKAVEVAMEKDALTFIAKTMVNHTEVLKIHTKLVKDIKATILYGKDVKGKGKING